MDFDILDSLDDLGYVYTDEEKFKECLTIGVKSIEFTHIIEWFSRELQAFCELDSCVNSITDPEDSSSFLLEVSSFLKELHCPYKNLVSGSISQRLYDVESRIILLDYLCTELQAARLISGKSEKRKSFDIEVDSSCTALSLNKALEALSITVPDDIDVSLLFSNVVNKLTANVDADSSTLPALAETLTESQWSSLNDLFNDFVHEYGIRRELLLTRLDVTIQSFKWGEESQGKEKDILNAYAHKRKAMLISPSVKLSDILAARESIFMIKKTSSADLTRSSMYKYLIPSVPDRGGRPKEQRPPVAMPSWMKRQPDSGNRGGHRGGYRGQKHGGPGKKVKKKTRKGLYKF